MSILLVFLQRGASHRLHLTLNWIGYFIFCGIYCLCGRAFVHLRSFRGRATFYWTIRHQQNAIDFSNYFLCKEFPYFSFLFFAFGLIIVPFCSWNCYSHYYSTNSSNSDQNRHHCHFQFRCITAFPWKCTFPFFDNFLQTHCCWIYFVSYSSSFNYY